MIADLGLAKEVTIEASNSVVYGMPAYVEPQCYKDGDYIRDEKSDIYSLGVLLWEITSGYPPFSRNSSFKDTALTFKIANGHREEPIINTPRVYVNLYQRCWNDDPKLRPTVNEVFVILEEQYNTIPKILEDVISDQILNNLKLSYLKNPLGKYFFFF
jgi:serine/threonine protein kinase